MPIINKVITINEYIKGYLDNNPSLQDVYIEGEIFSYRKNQSGHLYFALKDPYSQINCVMFRYAASNIDFVPKDGDYVLVKGNVNYYIQGGTLNFNVSNMALRGKGGLKEQFEKLKKELEQAGYFRPEIKKPLPKFPKAIGVLTSETGSVVFDIIRTINSRYHNGTKIIVYPTKVQGEDAKFSIASNIQKANMDNLCDVLIVARGGGSLEDLWPFNEKIVADAIYNSRLPIVSAVGHQDDYTICDYVSDLRVPTPTAAGNYVVSDTSALINELKAKKNELVKLAKNNFNNLNMYLDNLETKLNKSNPLTLLNQRKGELVRLTKDLNKTYNHLSDYYKNNLTLLSKQLKAFSIKDKVNNERDKIKNLFNNLNHNYILINNKKRETYNILLNRLKPLNPLTIMEKGYSISSIGDKYLRSTKEVKIGDRIETILKDGKIVSEVKEIK